MGRRGEASFIIFFGSEARNLSAVIYNLVTCLWFPLIFINIHIPPFPFLLWVTAPWKTPFILQTSYQSVWSSQIFGIETPSPLVPLRLCDLHTYFHESHERLKLNCSLGLQPRLCHFHLISALFLQNYVYLLYLHWHSQLLSSRQYRRPP